MRRKKTKKLLSIALSMVLYLGIIPANTMQVLAAPSSVNQEEMTQMVSDLELVYPSTYDGSERSVSFDNDWKFYLGSADGAENKSYDDGTWDSINLPHDYSITQAYSQSYEAESGYLPGGTGWYRKTFNIPKDVEGKRIRIDFGGVYMNATVWVNGEKLGIHPYGYTPFSFDITDQVIFGEDNVITVKVEHKTPSSRWYSGSGIYRSVELTITDPVHISLYGNKITTESLENNQDNVAMSIESTIQNDGNEDVSITLLHTLYEKDSDTALASVISDEQSISAGESVVITQTLHAESPALWSIDDPQLYVVKTQVMEEEQVLDTYETTYGFRYFSFDADTGFSLNGENLKLKGVCMHHDQGALGAVANAKAIRRQIEILKDMGCNSIRVTHNPAAKEFLEICDELGMLVINEAFDGWHYTKNGNTYDYATSFATKIGIDNEIIGGSSDKTWAEFDLKAMINSGYNSPSIIMWSLGNEVTEGTAYENETYVTQIGNLIEWARQEDTSRVVTTGDNKLKRYSANGNIFARMNQKLADADGTVGMNYASGTQYDTWHALNPSWKLYGAETASSVNSRGIYKITGYTGKNAYNQLTSYDSSKVNWGAYASQAWYEIIKRDYLAGEYVWTGFDYIGEPTNWNGTNAGAKGGTGSSWPAPKNSFFGIIDTAGLPKDSYYLYRSLWNEDSTTLHILPAWNEEVVEIDEDNLVRVNVYSNAKTVELFFTGEDGKEVSLGKKTFSEKKSSEGLYSYQLYEGEDKSSTEHENLYLTWNVAYADGSLRAVAYSDEEGTIEITDTVGRNKVQTASDEARVDAQIYQFGDSTLYADGKDLAYVELDIVDENGTLVPDADTQITISVEGEGELVGFDNGNSIDHTSYKSSTRSAFSGKAVAIIQMSKNAGEITVSASADGLESGSVVLESVAVENTDTDENAIESYKISKYYYVKRGYTPELPDTIEVNYKNQTTIQESVVWDEISEDTLNTASSFSLRGRVADALDVYINITMIDTVAAILNYSTATIINTKPTLPSTRPAVMANGDILKVSFPVEWMEPDASSYATVGEIVEVSGTANVMGESFEVKATVRVQEEDITIGSSVSGQARSLTQDIGNQKESDTLGAVKDGSTAVNANTSGGTNTSLWSNWSAAQAGVSEASLTFVYATQFRLGQVDIYFAKDANSLRYPNAGTTKLYISEDGQEWTQIETTEIIGESEVSTNVKQYTYTFSPVIATFVKVVVDNGEVETGTSRKASVGITEIELKTASGSYTIYDTTLLDSMSVNGVEVSDTNLANYTFETPALFVDTFETTSDKNIAVTLLPSTIGDKKAYVILEAEDQSERKVFEIVLNADTQEGSSDPEDDSRDYPYDKMTASGVNAQSGESFERVLDNNTSTLWHTNWKSTATLEERWIMLELEEVKRIDALRYYARDGQANGRVNAYIVEVSEDNQTWTQVAEGSFENTSGWKLASFSPVLAKYVRLTGVTTYGAGSQQNKFMSAGEIRVRLAEERIEIDDIQKDVVATLEKDTFIVESVGSEITPHVDLIVDGASLTYGIDYRIKYENNTSLGVAYAIVEGILKYSGTIRLPFMIVSIDSRFVQVEDGLIASVDGLSYGQESGQFEVGQSIILSVSEREDDTFLYWDVIPCGLDIDTSDPNATFTMPDSTVEVKAVYASDKKQVTTITDPDMWYAKGDAEQLFTILDAYITEDESMQLESGALAKLKLHINRSDGNTAIQTATLSDATYLRIATSSEAGIASPSNALDARATRLMREFVIEDTGEDMKTGFFLGAYLEKEFIDEETKVHHAIIEDVHMVDVTLEVPKRDRNMADYTVISYKRIDGEDLLSVVSSTEKDGYISFALQTDTIYGIFYNKTYEITFVDYDGTILDKQYVKVGELPEVVQDPKRDGYVFIGWNREIIEAFKDRTYTAKYKKIEVASTQTDEKESSSANTSSTIDTKTSVNKRRTRSSSSSNSMTSKKFSSSSTSTGSWESVITGTWKYKLSDDTYAKDTWIKSVAGYWYRFDASEAMQTGWYKSASGTWFYLYPGKGDSQGRMLTGWQWIMGTDGITRCYYFETSDGANQGAMAINTTIDGYSVGMDGAWVVDGIIQTK